jgi:O-antigen ligase
MLNSTIEKTLIKLLAIGSAFITVFIVVGPVADPVNVSKFLAAGILSFGVAALLIRSGLDSQIKNNKLFVGSLVLFLVTSISSVIFSDVPFTQNLYGEAGRNTGFLTYFFLGLIALGGASLTEREGFTKILYGFFAAGFVNLAYGLWAWLFGDFVAWNNIYGNLLGTFGNPNFMGAFLGMLGTAFVAYAAAPGQSWKVRIVALVLWVITFLEILQTNAVQGLVLISGGLALVGLFLLVAKAKSFLIPTIYISAVSSLGFIAIAGALQKGPLAEYIYKRSVSLRGSYWQTAINIGLDNPLTGVGMDSYGTFYRKYRTVGAATDMPGPETTTNAAHSVPLDFLAYGGFPLFIAYLLIVVISAVALAKTARRLKSYDPVFVALASIWICYQIQSIISINQLGLAVWGWLLSGLMISYERITRPQEQLIDSKGIQSKSNKKSKEPVVAAGLIASVGMVVGLLIALPPYTSDYKYLKAMNSQNLEKIEDALKPSYFNPIAFYRIVGVVGALERSELPDIAIVYARQAVEFSPNEYDAWKTLYRATASTPEEKNKAKKMMLLTDPLNKTNKELP